MTGKIIIIFFVILLLQLPVFAEETPDVKLNICEAVELAVEKNFDINQRRKDINIATNKIKEANRLKDSEINTLFLFGDTALGNPQQIGLTQDIEILKRGPRKYHARAEKNVTVSEVDLDIFNLKMDVREAYIEAAYAKSMLDIVKQQQAALMQMVNVAKKRVDVGVAPEIELLQAQIIYDQLQIAYNKAQTLILTTRADFNRILNVTEYETYDICEELLPVDAEFYLLLTPQPQQKLIPYEKIEQLALQRRWDIIIAQKEIVVAKKYLAVVRSKRIPDIEVFGGFMYLTSSKNNDITISNGGALYGSYAGVNIELPILYLYRPEIKNAQLKIQQKELNAESVRIKALNNVKKAYENFEVARKNLNFYTEKLLTESEATVKAARRSYEVGKSPIANLILMEQSNLNILSNYINALATYYFAWVDLLREINVEEIE